MDNKDIPHIDQTGNIIIPFNADQKYQYWNGGQKLAETMIEIQAPEDYLEEIFEESLSRGCGVNW